MRKKNKFFIGFHFLLLLSFSCSDPYCDELEAKLDKIQCNDVGEECLVDMKQIFGDNWEYLYIFSGFNMTEDISKAIGFDCDCKTIYDHTRLILLVSNNKIIESHKTECYSINLDRIIKNGFVKIDSSDSELLFLTTSKGDNKNYIFTLKN